MLKIFKKSFKILLNNLLFIQPLLLLLLMLMTAAAFIANKNLFTIPKVLLLISMILLLTAFSAGWFYINKLGILSYNDKDLKEEAMNKSVQNLKKFFDGVGIGFFKTLFSYFILAVIYAAVIIGMAKFCLIVFGEPKIFYELPKLAQAGSQAELLNLFGNMTVNDKITFSNWIMTVNITVSIINFFCVLYFAVNNFEKSNVFKSLFLAVKFFIKNILGVISIILLMFLLYIVLNIMSLLLGASAVSFVILIILFTLYFNYYLILVFCFYNEKSDSNNRSELIG